MKRTAKIAMIMWIGIIALIHISYFVIVRKFLSADPVSMYFNAEVSYVQKPIYYDLAPKYIADHFLHSFCISQYFLFIHLWFGYEYCYERITNRNQDKSKAFMKIELFGLLGTILPYIVFWIRDTSDSFLLPVGNPIFSIYTLINKKNIFMRGNQGENIPGIIWCLSLFSPPSSSLL